MDERMTITLFDAIKHMFVHSTLAYPRERRDDMQGRISFKTKDKLEAFQVLLRHILAVKYRTEEVKNANAEREFMGIHKNVNSSHDKIIFYMAFYLGIFLALL